MAKMAKMSSAKPSSRSGAMKTGGSGGDMNKMPAKSPAPKPQRAAASHPSLNNMGAVTNRAHPFPGPMGKQPQGKAATPTELGGYGMKGSSYGGKKNDARC
jgi:hypothetical protein